MCKLVNVQLCKYPKVKMRETASTCFFSHFGCDLELMDKINPGFTTLRVSQALAPMEVPLQNNCFAGLDFRLLSSSSMHAIMCYAKSNAWQVYDFRASYM